MWKPALLQRIYLAKKQKQKLNKKKRSQNVKLPDVLRHDQPCQGYRARIEWEMLLSQLPCGHSDKTAFNALTHCCIRPMCNARWPSWHSVDSTNYASLPDVRSHGQGHGSVANGLLADDCWFCQIFQICVRSFKAWPFQRTSSKLHKISNWSLNLPVMWDL